MSENPAIHRQPSGDVDIALPSEDRPRTTGTEAEPAPTADEDPAKGEHPEEAGGG